MEILPVGIIVLNAVVQCFTQELIIPAEGSDEFDDVTMTCTFEEGLTTSEVDSIRWTHTMSYPSGTLLFFQFSDAPDGIAHNDWINRNVTGIFGDRHHEVKLSTLTRSDSKVYFCTYEKKNGGFSYASNTLYINVPPKEELSFISPPHEITESVEVDYMCELQEVRPLSRTYVSWTISNRMEDNSTTYETEPMDHNLFQINASYRTIFTKDDHTKTVTCNIYWDNNEQFTKSEENINVFYSPGPAMPSQDVYEALIGQNSTIACNAEPGNPEQMTYTFVQNNKTEFNKTSTDGFLVIAIETFDRHGSYECWAINTRGLQGASGCFSIDVKDRPTITNLHVNFNITSTVLPISWVIHSFGGFSSVTFTIWIKDSTSSNYDLWRDDIRMNVKEGGLVQINVDGLVPNRMYDIKVAAESEWQGGDVQSEPLYITAATRDSPVLNIDEVLVSSFDLIVTWIFVQKARQDQVHQKMDPHVTLCIKYWLSEDGEETSVIHPSRGHCVIEAFRGNEVIHDNFDPTKIYYIQMIIYENGIPGSNSGNSFKMSTAENPGELISPGGIAAIVTSLILVLFIALMALLVFLGVININKEYLNGKCLKEPTDVSEDATVSWDKAYSEMQMTEAQLKEQAYEKLHQQKYENTGFQQYETLDKVTSESSE